MLNTLSVKNNAIIIKAHKSMYNSNDRFFGEIIEY